MIVASKPVFLKSYNNTTNSPGLSWCIATEIFAGARLETFDEISSLASMW